MMLRRLLLEARKAWWLFGWGVFATIWCRRLRCIGLNRLPAGPLVLAANHASHADTVVMQLLLARAGRSRVLVAGAEDYWFRNRVLATIARCIGAFAFPRSGKAGVRRASRILERGWSVLIYPQGTRSGGPFRPGVGMIASEAEVPVVPVAIEGTGALLPKGRFWPRRSTVTVRFMAPLVIDPQEDPADFASKLESTVIRRGLEAEAA